MANETPNDERPDDGPDPAPHDQQPADTKRRPGRMTMPFVGGGGPE